MTAKQATKTLKKEGAPAAMGMFPYWVAAAGWAVPGLGHLLLKKWDRSAVFFVSVGAMAVLGLASGGHLYSPDLSSPREILSFDTLGFLADLCAGCFYFAARILGFGAFDIGQAWGDYGTVFFLTAGLLNLLCLLDAYDIALGEKE